MFEQSVSTGNKTGALAASVTAQTLAVGLLIMLPLIYSDRLPDFRPLVSLTLPLSPSPPAAQSAARSQSTRPSLPASRPMFQLPSRTPQPIEAGNTPILTDTLAPTLTTTGVPFSTGPIGVHVIDVPPPPQPHPAPAVKTPEKPRLVGGDVQAAKLLKKVMPVYPALAKQARISGTVHLMGVVAKDGTIQQLRVVDGHPLLVGAALDAVRQWAYKPTTLNGEPVEVIAPIDVIFTLSN